MVCCGSSCTSAAERITPAPTSDSAYRWISWQVPVMTVRRVTTGGLSALACWPPAQHSDTPTTSVATENQTRAMAPSENNGDGCGSGVPRCARTGFALQLGEL